MAKALVVPLKKHSPKHHFFNMVTCLGGGNHREYVTSYLMIFAIASCSWKVPTENLIKDESDVIEKLEYLGWIKVEGKMIDLLPAFQKKCEQQVARYLNEFKEKTVSSEKDVFMIGKYRLHAPAARKLLK